MGWKVLRCDHPHTRWDTGIDPGRLPFRLAYIWAFRKMILVFLSLVLIQLSSLMHSDSLAWSGELSSLLLSILPATSSLTHCCLPPIPCSVPCPSPSPDSYQNPSHPLKWSYHHHLTSCMTLRQFPSGYLGCSVVRWGSLCDD